MIAQTQIEGGWTELKGKVKEAWGQINDDELREFEGNVDQLVGLIQRKTGEAQKEIERQLAELDERFRPMLQQVADSARQYYEQTIAATGETYDRVRDQFSARHAQAEEVVRQRPMEAVAVAFGTGILAGVVLGLIVRSR
jgi:uncharacterized protein YjbJ (UPF0337 family)